MTELSSRIHEGVILAWNAEQRSRRGLKNQNMNAKTSILTILITGALLGGLGGCASEKEQAAALETKAKVTRSEAERIALAKVPNGAIKEGGIEEEKGRVIWSFDIATPGAKDITEVAVDAQTGEVVAIDKETPEGEAKEQK